jgi:hypothetical protein
VIGRSSILYLDSSAILRPVLEQGFSPDVEQRINDADVLITLPIGAFKPRRRRFDVLALQNVVCDKQLFQL